MYQGLAFISYNNFDKIVKTHNEMIMPELTIVSSVHLE